MAVRARVKIPKRVRAGEIFTVKTLVSHSMESGERVDPEGKRIPRHIINRFEVTFNRVPVFAVDIHPGVAANPFFQFTARIDTSGTFRLRWTDDDGEVTELSRDVTVEDG